jgi:hypothetical protein
MNSIRHSGSPQEGGADTTTPSDSAPPPADNKFEFSDISTIHPIVSTEFFAKCRGDTRTY